MSIYLYPCLISKDVCDLYDWEENDHEWEEVEVNGCEEALYALEEQDEGLAHLVVLTHIHL